MEKSNEVGKWAQVKKIMEGEQLLKIEPPDRPPFEGRNDFEASIKVR